MTEVDPSESAKELQTVDVSSQLLLTSKRMQVQQLQLIGGLGGGHFAHPDQNRMWSPDSGLWYDGEDNDETLGSKSTLLEESEDEEAQAAKAKRRRKGTQAVSESSCKNHKLRKLIVAESQMTEAATPEATTIEARTEEAPLQHKETSAMDPLVLSDEDDLVPNPEHDKFNLANQVLRKVLLEAREKHNTTRDSSAQAKEEQDRNIVRVKFELYWELKNEKRRKKVESEALHRQEVGALKEFVRRVEEVEQNVSRSITSLAQSVQESIQERLQENNHTMMQVFSQMLQGVGFTPALQSSYNQGQYPLALGFKTPPHVTPLPRPVIDFTPPATLPGVQTPAFGQTEENPSEEG